MEAWMRETTSAPYEAVGFKKVSVSITLLESVKHIVIDVEPISTAIFFE